MVAELCMSCECGERLQQMGLALMTKQQKHEVTNRPVLSQNRLELQEIRGKELYFVWHLRALSKMNSSGIIFCTILIGEKVAELKNSKLFV